MSAWHEQLDVRNPERQIGTTLDGQPIFLDLRELITSPAEHEEKRTLTLNSRNAETVRKLAILVLRNAKLFIESTLGSIMGQSILRSSDAAMADWVEREGYVVRQIGLETIILRQGKVVRTMTAKVVPPLRDSVAMAVNELTKKIPANV